MTILEVLNWANDKLKKAEIDSPMLDAEVILSNIMDVRKSWLFSHFNDLVRTHHEEAFTLAISRRTKHEPVAYIIGSKHFYKRPFIVNPSVLIPRPATETIITEALACTEDAEDDKTLLCDIGTGSGAIAITLSLETELPVIATDISQASLSVAKQNATTLGAKEIDFQHGDLLEPIVKLFKTIRGSSDPKVSSVYPFKDLIICANLPYLSEVQMERLDKDVSFEPDHALRAGQDGLDAYFQLFKQLSVHRNILPRNTTLLIEIDPGQTQKAINIITHNFPSSTAKVIKDLQGNERVIMVQI